MELTGQPALADSGFAVDGDQVGVLFLDNPLKQGAEEREFVLAPDHRGAKQWCYLPVGWAEKFVDLNRLAASPERYGSKVPKTEPAAGPNGPIRYQHLTRRGGLFQPRRHVHCISGNLTHIGPGGRGGNHLAGIDADAGRKRYAVGSGEPSIQFDKTLHHALGGAESTVGIIVVGDGHSEYSHDRVPDELLYASTEGLDLSSRGVEESSHDFPEMLGIQLLTQTGRSADVGKENGHQFAFTWRRFGMQVHATVRAESGAVRKTDAASGAGITDGGSTRSAVPRVGRDFLSTICAASCHLLRVYGSRARVASIANRKECQMVAIKERIEILGGVPLFESLSKHQMRKLANLVKEVEHPVGHVVVEEGQVGVGFHIILSGRVKVTVGGRTRRYMEAGAYFGELALVDRGPRSATVTVSEQSTMLYLPGLDFRKLLLGDAALCYKLLVQVSQRLRDAEKSRTS